MTNPTPSLADLLKMIQANGGKTEKKPRKKSKPRAKQVEGSLSVPPIQRLDSPRWRDEAVVFLKTRTICACGAESEQTNPYPLLRRWHPKYGIHDEAIRISHRSSMLKWLDVKIEERVIPLQNCHQCLTSPDRHFHAFPVADLFDPTPDIILLVRAFDQLSMEHLV